MKSQNKKEKALLIDEDDPHFDDKLSVCRKLCFGVGGIPYTLTNTVINFFINVFLLEVARIRPAYVSIVLLVGKVWDGVSDPLCGFLVNRTTSKLGKYKPWILFSAPFACTAYFFLFYVPEDFSAELKLVWYLVSYCMFQTFLTGLHVPYTSMTMCVTNSQSERDSVTAYRMATEATGVLLGVAIQGYFVQSAQIDCDSFNSSVDEGRRENEERSYMLGSTTVVAIYMCCAVCIFFGVKEKKGLIKVEESGFFESVKMVFTHGPFIRLCACFSFGGLALSIIQGNIALYTIHTLKLEDRFVFFIFTVLVTAILCMPLWQLILKRLGKKTAFAASMMISIPTATSYLYLPTGRPEYMYAVMFLGGISTSAGLLLPWSMLPDVLDDFMVTHGQRKDAIFYSFYVFFNKVSAGVGLGITQIVLEFAGYNTEKCTQPDSVAEALRYLLTPGPVVLLILALLALWSYPINETRRRRNRAEIEKLAKDEGRNEETHLEKSKITDVSVSYESIGACSNL